jgi:hypothetical protein
MSLVNFVSQRLCRVNITTLNSCLEIPNHQACTVHTGVGGGWGCGVWSLNNPPVKRYVWHKNNYLVHTSCLRKHFPSTQYSYTPVTMHQFSRLLNFTHVLLPCCCSLLDQSVLFTRGREICIMVAFNPHKYVGFLPPFVYAAYPVWD